MYNPPYVPTNGYAQPTNLTAMPFQQGGVRVFPQQANSVPLVSGGQGYSITPPYRQFTPPNPNPVPGSPGTSSRSGIGQSGGTSHGPPPSWNLQSASPLPSSSGTGDAPLQLLKPRNKEVGEPSAVLHMRNVDSNVTQLSIEEFVRHFGKIKRLVMLRQKHQALIEMESRRSAQELIDAVRETGYAEIDHSRVYILYSTHQELTSIQQPSCILFVSMQTSDYQMTPVDTNPDIVYAIFSKYGKIRKLVIVNKQERSQSNSPRPMQGRGIQALVQFATTEDAEHVKSVLQGQPVRLNNGTSFRLDIQFSRMADLKVINPLTSLLVDEHGNVSRPVAPTRMATPVASGPGTLPMGMTSNAGSPLSTSEMHKNSSPPMPPQGMLMGGPPQRFYPGPAPPHR